MWKQKTVLKRLSGKTKKLSITFDSIRFYLTKQYILFPVENKQFISCKQFNNNVITEMEISTFFINMLEFLVFIFVSEFWFLFIIILLH